jgi:hypothetical protein
LKFIWWIEKGFLSLSKIKRIMKNIHILPTEHKSKIGTYKSKKLYFHQNVFTESNFEKNFYLYITSDEEIKEGNYIGYPNLKNWVPVKYLGGNLIGIEKKIILTTDQDLIADGVEQISEDTLLKIVEHINSGKNIESLTKNLTKQILNTYEKFIQNRK